MKKENLELITIEISLLSDLDKVWHCWTLPEHIVNWNFASAEWCCPSAVNNLVKNGGFSWRMETKDGSVGFDFTGEYLEINEMDFITYKMSDGRMVRIDFLKNGKEVILKETFEAEGTNSDEQQRAGWLAILGNFKKYVEESKSI